MFIHARNAKSDVVKWKMSVVDVRVVAVLVFAAVICEV